MKNIKKIFVCLVALFIAFGVSSCFSSGSGEDVKTYYNVHFDTRGGSAISSIMVEKGTLLEKPVDPKKENYTFLGWYTDKDTTIKYDFTKPVEDNLTIYAGWEVVNQILVLGVAQNSNLIEFVANKEEKENKKTEFFDRTQNYIVGDDNPFSIKPEVSFISYNPETGETDSISVEAWKYEVKVLLKENDTYKDVTTLKEYVDAIDEVKCSVDFNSKAIGKTFKVQVVPKGLTEKQLAKVEDYTTSFEFDVVDGFNLYDAKEMAYIDNRKSGVEADAWKEFKNANNLLLDYAPARIICHKDINITVNDLPKLYFYQKEELKESDPDYQRTLGSMKDFYEFYLRNVASDESFAISGNYFTISNASLKEVTREWGKVTPEGEVISHATLFKFIGGGNARMENLNLVGNAPRVENTIKAGGQISHKVENVNFTCYNVISACYFITFFAEQKTTKYLAEKCKAYDSFNCFVYNWGCPDFTIQECEMIGAGGPVIIQDHVHPEASDGGSMPDTKVINSKLESYVTGTEGWFTVMKASAIVPQVKGLNAVFAPVGRSFLKTSKDGSLTYFNFICITKSGSAQGITQEKISGSISLDGKAFNYGKDDPYLKGMLDLTFAQGAPTFQSINSVVGKGYGYFNGKTLCDVTNAPIVDPTNPLFTGDYLCLYYSGMAFVMGYGPAGEIH